MVWSVFFPWCSSWCLVSSCFLFEYDRCWTFVKNFIQSGPILQHHKYFLGRGTHLNEMCLFLSFSLSHPLFGPRVYCNNLNRLRGFPFASAVVRGGKLGSECKPISCCEILWAGWMYTELNSSCIFGPFVIKYRLSVQTRKNHDLSGGVGFGHL